MQLTWLRCVWKLQTSSGPIILDKEARWLERGVWEAIWEQVEQPALNTKGGGPSVFSCRMHGMKQSEVFPAVYHVTNQRSDEVWSFQMQHSQVSCKILIPVFDLTIFYNMIMCITCTLLLSLGYCVVFDCQIQKL